MANRIIVILQHRISYWYDNDQNMPEHEQDYIERMIEKGYNQGELNDENETGQNRGWWKIIK